MATFLTRPSDLRRRRLVVAAALLGAVLMVAAYWLPWWHFHMTAPQYPKGLDLVIYLHGVTGDVQEINIINHYIGMAHLDEAAKWERAHALSLLALIALSVLLLVNNLGRKLNSVLVAIAAALPAGFLLDTFYWMYRFGHELDPRAPVEIAGFTPTLFGEGKIGQFVTQAGPSAGFVVAAVGAVLVTGAALMRNRVCHSCPLHDRCSLVCAGRSAPVSHSRAAASAAETS